MSNEDGESASLINAIRAATRSHSRLIMMMLAKALFCVFNCKCAALPTANASHYATSNVNR